jgi:nucleoside-diphosphate-sugar epimerase
MRVLLFGGTGYIGSAILRRLLSAGHQPVVALRPGRDAMVTDVPSVVADLSDPAAAARVVTRDIDAIIHAANPTDDWAVDLATVSALLAALHDGQRAFIYTSGVWVIGRTSWPGVDETVQPAPIGIVSGRPAVERAVLDAATAGVRSSVIRPGLVHGHGRGILSTMVGWAAEHGTGVYVGDATTRWPMVHVEDLADLYLLALEQASAGSVLHGVAEPAVRVEDLARAADRLVGGPGRAQSWPAAEAIDRLGAAFVEALTLDQAVHAPAARALGWRPAQPDALTDLRTGVYAPQRSLG